MACEEGSITIPHDIIIDILHRLPAKSVGRVRCVSKEWLSVLSEPGFIKTHYKKTRNTNHLIFKSNRYLDSIYSLSFDNLEGVSTLTKLPIGSGTLYIEGSCNGLVLVHASFDMSYKDTFYILNPTIKDYVEFSASEVTHKHLCNLYGFGYDSVTDDYKVVAISYYHYLYLNPPDNDVYVYSLRSDTWRKVSDSPFNHFYGDLNSGVFVNGVLHWIAEKDSDHGVIAAFCLADEKFSEVPSPYLYNDVNILSNNDHCKLVALGEKLAIFDHVKGVVWLMNEYGVKESWTKIVVHGLSESPLVEPMIFYDNGKIVFVNCDLKLLNNAEEKCLGKSDDVRRDKKVLELKVQGTYVESLLLPKIGPSN